MVVQRQRFRCLECKRVWLQPLRDIDEKHRLFKRVVDYIHKEAVARTHSSIAREIGVDSKTVHNIVSEWAAEINKTYRPPTTQVLAINEITAFGQRRCVCTDLLTGQILDLLETRSREAVQNWLLGLDNPQSVRLASIIPWNGYRVALQSALPWVRILVQTEHILALANRCLEHFRRDFKRTITPDERWRMKQDQFLLLAAEKDLRPEAVHLRDSWLGRFPALSRAYRLKEDFIAVFEAGERREAQAQYAAWEASIQDELKPSFELVTTAMRSWREEVYNSFDFRPQVLHPFSEGAGPFIANIMKNGRGYKFEILRAKVLSTVLPPATKRVTKIKETICA